MRSERLAKIGALPACALSLAVSASAAPAPTMNDDVRCFLLSAGYARAASNEGSRRGAAMTGAFFLGRLSSRLSSARLAAAIRAQGVAPGKGAEALMRACAARATATEQAMAATIRAAQAVP